MPAHTDETVGDYGDEPAGYEAVKTSVRGRVYSALLAGDICACLGQPTVTAAVAESFSQVRVYFSLPMTVDDVLRAAESYTITALLGAAVRTVLRVQPLASGWPTSVLLYLDGDLTPGTNNYNVEVSDEATSIGGETLDPAADDADFGLLALATPGPRQLQGSIFKHPLRFANARYTLRVEEFTAVGDDYYATSLGTTDLSFPPLTEDPLDPDTDYWMGGGVAAYDLLAIWETLGIGSMTLVTTTAGTRGGVPEDSGPGFIRCQWDEETGGASHYKALWNDGATDLPLGLFGFTDAYRPAPQLGDPTESHARETAAQPPQGVLRLEYLPTEDSTPQTPVVVGKARALDGAVEAASYGTATDVRVLFWSALFQRVVVIADREATATAICLQEFLRDWLLPGELLRFYLRETQEPDDYWQCVGTPPATQDYSRSQRDKSKKKWQWRVELTEAAE